MNKNLFLKKLSKITEAYSITGKFYHSIQVSGDKILFIRSHKDKSESIAIDELYQLYTKEHKTGINTVIAKKYITNRVQSPSVAILLQLAKN